MITARPYRYLVDHMSIYDFMTEIYEPNWKNGVPAPFLEYALCSTWMDKRYLQRNRIWLDGEQIVGFVFTETDPTQIFFSLRPGYECLAEEMVRYAEDYMPRKDGRQTFILFRGQDALLDIVRSAGYRKINEYTDGIYDMEKNGLLDCPLPAGFHFVDNGQISLEKLLTCIWKGFDHEEKEGPWTRDHIDDGYLLQTAPHYTPQYPVVIADDRTGEYVCYAGMWWTPQNRLAYMEPLATIPAYRKKGLASAALSELCRRMRPLGATHMTGGSNPFYAKLGYQPMITWTEWERG